MSAQTNKETRQIQPRLTNDLFSISFVPSWGAKEFKGGGGVPVNYLVGSRIIGYGGIGKLQQIVCGLFNHLLLVAAAALVTEKARHGIDIVRARDATVDTNGFAFWDVTLSDEDRPRPSFHVRLA